VPSVVNYQGRLTDNTPQQNPLDATVTIEFSVWDAATGGASLWTETQSVQVAKGLFSVLLGSVTSMPPTLFPSGDTRYLEIHVNGETLTPRQRIATAPFASVAGSADNALALGGVGAAAYQQRIGTPCPAGYAINAVAADGTATCIQGIQGPPGPPGNGLDTGAIAGTVTTCGGPAAGVLVYVPGRSAVSFSGADGSYQLSYLPAGSYTVQFKTPGLQGASTANGVIVAGGQTTGQGVTNVADVSADVNNCGACGAACSSNHVTRTCFSGTCAGACDFGFDDCNGNRQIDGCETSVRADAANCGGCGMACSANHATPSCSNSVCGGNCDTGFANCDGNFRLNGCETDVSNDPQKCGACFIVCSGNHIPTPSCAGGFCNGACAAGFGDCNGNKQSDGCETDLGNSNDHCGSCGNVCTGGQTCVGGICS
jgi:hypothetical protein